MVGAVATAMGADRDVVNTSAHTIAMEAGSAIVNTSAVDGVTIAMGVNSEVVHTSAADILRAKQ